MATSPKANPRTRPASSPKSSPPSHRDSRCAPLARAARVGAVALAATLLGACRATRELAIESTPPGAEVRVDDVVVGTTPMRLPFKDFGTRRVTLYKPGYLTHSELVVLDPPWYATFPLDVFTEVLLPLGWHYVQPYRTTLVEGSGSIASPELQDVLGRAEVLRRAGPEGPQRQPDTKAPESKPPESKPPEPEPSVPPPR